MGVRSPFGYVGFELRFADTMCDLLDCFCRGCHTEEDFENGCRGCPIGALIYAAKDYVLNAYEGNPVVRRKSRKLQRKYKLLCSLKKAVKPIGPYPCFNAQWIWEKKESPDILEPVRKLVSEIRFHEEHEMHPFLCSQDDRYIEWAMLEHDKGLAKEIAKKAREIRERREREFAEDEKERRAEIKKMKKEKRGFGVKFLTPEEAMEDM